MSLVREAVAVGARMDLMEDLIDLEPLRAYPPFVEFLRPKG